MALFCAVVHSGPATCLSLLPERSLRSRILPRATACAVVAVQDGEPTQLIIDQPVDLIVRQVDGKAVTVVDGFEFGRETVTIAAPGEYRVEAVPADTSAAAAWIFSISRRAIPSGAADLWRRAEAAATLSKRSGRPEDIAESLALWKQVNDTSAIARTFLKQGDATLLRTSATAREAYEQALSLCDSISDLRCSGEAANNSGYASFLLGDFPLASRRLRQAAEIWRRISFPLAEGQTLSNLGLLYSQAGDFGQAIGELEQAKTLLRGRDQVAYARALNNLGFCYHSLSNHQAALAYFQTALPIFTVRHIPAVRLRMNIGCTDLLLGRLDSAKATLELALSEANDSSVRAEVLNNLGQVLLKLHRAAEARACLTEALGLHRAVHSARGEAASLHYLGVEAEERDDLEAGRRWLSEAARIRQETGMRDDASESLFALAELEYKAHRTVAARDLAERAAGLIESERGKVASATLRASYYGRKRRFFDLLADIAMDDAGPGGAAGFLVSERAHGRSLLDLLASGAIGAAIPRQLMDRRNDLQRQIAVLSLRLTDADPPNASEATRRQLENRRGDLRRRIELLLSDDDELETKTRETMNGTAFGQPLTSVAALQAGLPPDTALLEYYLGERNGYLWVVRQDTIQSFRLPPRADIETLATRTAQRFGAILDRRRSPQAQAAFQADLRALSAMLLGMPAGSRLPRRLILVLDGVLNRVPVEALRPAWARAELGLDFEVVRVPSAAFLLAAHPPNPLSTYPRSVLAIADPVYGGDDPRLPPGSAPVLVASLPRLPFTGELSLLGSLVSPRRIRVLSGFDADVATFRKIDLRSFAILHFSTHAVVDDAIPELSRVALSLIDRTGRPVDGYLHPYQLADLQLNRSIVVLSSCETALGREVPGEGLVGFAASLFSAGASQLVLSLSKVDAESSSAFFSEVYRNFFGARRAGMENALQRARLAMAQSIRWSDPYYWASFTVVGSPSAAR